MANNRVQVKRTSTTGRTPNTTGSYATNSQYISAGELALNMTDGILYSSDGTNLITVGSNLATQRITSNITLDNNTQLRFRTVNSSAFAYFTQQNDDNFVFYTTNASYGARAVFSIFANSSTSDFQLGQPVTFNGANVKFSTGTALSANGSLGSAGQVLTTNGSTVYWSSVSGSGSVNVSAQYTWTNLHTFSANVAFTGNGIGITSNTGAIYLGGLADNNWKIGRNTGSTTKWRYTNNSIDIITANSNLEGFAIGLISGNSYFETGYLGTFIAANVTIGNSSSNSTINSTAFSGSANNTTYLNGQLASYYTNATNITTGTLPYAQIPANIVNTTGSFTISGVHTYNANVTIATSAGIIANGTIGTIGQVLASNGSSVYWVDSSNYIRQSFTGDGITTSFAVTGGYTANQIDVYVNGLKMASDDVTISSGTSVVFTVAPPNGSVIDVIGIKATIMNFATVNTSAAYTWTNTHSFTNTVTLKAISANGGLGTAGQALISNGTSTYWGNVSSVSGSDTQVQYNDGGFSNASAGFVFTKTTNNVTVANSLFAAVVNAASHTVGVSTIANSTGVYTGVVNGSSLTVGTSTIANSTGVYTGIVNGSSLTVGTSFTANSILVNTAAINITGQTNTATLFITTSANIASSNIIANTAGLFVANSTGVVNSASFSVGTSFIANSTGVYDASDNLRSIPTTTQSAVYQLATTDNGKTVSTTANVTVNGAVLLSNQNFTIFNNSAASITILSGTGATMYLAGTSNTGNRTLSQRGLATVLMVASNTFVISGSGLS